MQRVRVTEPTVESSSPPSSTPQYPEARAASPPIRLPDGQINTDHRTSFLSTTRVETMKNVTIEEDRRQEDARSSEVHNTGVGDYVHISADICKSCGSHFLDDAIFCRKCGARRTVPSAARVAASAVAHQASILTQELKRGMHSGASSVPVQAPVVAPVRTLPARTSVFNLNSGAQVVSGAAQQATTTTGVARSSSAGHVGSTIRSVTPPPIAHTPPVVPVVKEYVARPSMVMERQQTTRVVEPPVQVQTLRAMPLTIPQVTVPAMQPQVQASSSARRVSAIVVEPPITTGHVTTTRVINSPSTTEEVRSPSPEPEVRNLIHVNEDRILTIVTEKFSELMRTQNTLSTTRTDGHIHRLEQEISEQCSRLRRDLEEQMESLRQQLEAQQRGLSSLATEQHALQHNLHICRDQLTEHVNITKIKSAQPVVMDTAGRQDATRALELVRSLQQTVERHSDRMDKLVADMAGLEGKPTDSFMNHLAELRSEIDTGARKEQTFLSRFDALDREVKALRANLLQRPWESSSHPAVSQESEELLRAQRERLQVLAAELSEAQHNGQIALQALLSDRFEQERKVREAQYDGLHGIIKGQRVILDDARTALTALEQVVRDHRSALGQELEVKCRIAADDYGAIVREIRESLQATLREATDARLQTEASLEERLYLLESFHDSMHLLFRDGLNKVGGWHRRRHSASTSLVSESHLT